MNKPNIFPNNFDETLGNPVWVRAHQIELRKIFPPYWTQVHPAEMPLSIVSALLGLGVVMNFSSGAFRRAAMIYLSQHDVIDALFQGGVVVVKRKAGTPEAIHYSSETHDVVIDGKPTPEAQDLAAQVLSKYLKA